MHFFFLFPGLFRVLCSRCGYYCKKRPRKCAPGGAPPARGHGAVLRLGGGGLWGARAVCAALCSRVLRGSEGGPAAKRCSSMEMYGPG